MSPPQSASGLAQSETLARIPLGLELFGALWTSPTIQTAPRLTGTAVPPALFKFSPIRKLIPIAEKIWSRVFR